MQQFKRLSWTVPWVYGVEIAGDRIFPLNLCRLKLFSLTYRALPGIANTCAEQDAQQINDSGYRIYSLDAITDGLLILLSWDLRCSRFIANPIAHRLNRSGNRMRLFSGAGL
ncbi:hypothetical protein THIOKS1940005 [Thiocapsa sp. KS1]|nr:hypothetical protein THIOKS1940005 [Thiocapsa sp. KS1]